MRSGDDEERRERDRVFGDVLPEQTVDDVEPEDDRPATDEWLRRQVPPHHGS